MYDMIDQKIAFSEYVLLIDVDFLNGIVEPIRCPAASGGDELPRLDWGRWLSFLALDAGIRPGSNELQVLLLYKAGVDRVACCNLGLLDELNGKACQTTLGEMQFACVPTADMTSTDELFVNLLQLAYDAKEVRQLLLLPHPAYGERVVEALTELFHDKPALTRKVTYFALYPNTVTLPCKVDTAFYSIAKAFGL